MNIRAIVLAGVLGLPLVAGAAFAAESGNQSLVDAAKLGDREAVRSLLNGRTKEDVAGIFLQGATPLAMAAEINNFDAIVALVDGGADPLIPTEKNTTPLILAAGAGTDVVRPRSTKERKMAIQTVKFLVVRLDRAARRILSRVE